MCCLEGISVVQWRKKAAKLQSKIYCVIALKRKNKDEKKEQRKKPLFIEQTIIKQDFVKAKIKAKN